MSEDKRKYTFRFPPGTGQEYELDVQPGFWNLSPQQQYNIAVKKINYPIKDRVLDQLVLANDAVWFGGGSELGALISALKDGITGEGSFKEDFDESLNRNMRAHDASKFRARLNNPLVSGTSEALSGLTGGIGTTGAIQTAQKLAPAGMDVGEALIKSLSGSLGRQATVDVGTDAPVVSRVVDAARPYAYSSAGGASGAYMDAPVDERGQAARAGSVFAPALNAAIDVTTRMPGFGRRATAGIKNYINQADQTFAEKEAVESGARALIRDAQIANRGADLPQDATVPMPNVSEGDMIVDAVGPQSQLLQRFDEAMNTGTTTMTKDIVRNELLDREAGAAGRRYDPIVEGVGVGTSGTQRLRSTLPDLEANRNSLWEAYYNGPPIDISNRFRSIIKRNPTSRKQFNTMYKRIVDKYNLENRGRSPLDYAPETLDEFLNGYRNITRGQRDTFTRAGWKVTQKTVNGKTTYRATNVGNQGADRRMMVLFDDELQTLIDKTEGRGAAPLIAAKKEWDRLLRRDPAFRDAKKASSEVISVQNAEVAGRRDIKPTVSGETFAESAALDVGSESPIPRTRAQSDVFKASAVEGIEPKITGQSASSLLDDPRTMSKVETLFDDPELYGAYTDTLSRQQAQEVTKAAAGKTRRTLAQEFAESDSLLDKVGHVGSRAAELGFSVAFASARILDRLTAQGRALTNKDARDAFINLVTSEGPAAQRNLDLLRSKVGELTAKDRKILDKGLVLYWNALTSAPREVSADMGLWDMVP